MKVTNLKQQIKNTERISVFVDGKYAFSLSLDELVTEKIKNGQGLDQAELKRLKKLSEDGKIKMRAMAWLLNRPHSERELRDYLRRKKAEDELTDSLVNQFKVRGYLDDHKYAAWLYELRGRAGKSDRAIRSELFSKGVSREVVEEVLESGVGEESRLNKLISKKRQSLRYKNDDMKLAKYLTSQGFSYSMVREALKVEASD